MEWRELPGFIGGALTTVGFVPQAWRLFTPRSGHEIGLPFTVFFVTAIGFWLCYGISTGLPSVIMLNAIAFAPAICPVKREAKIWQIVPATIALSQPTRPQPSASLANREDSLPNSQRSCQN